MNDPYMPTPQTLLEKLDMLVGHSLYPAEIINPDFEALLESFSRFYEARGLAIGLVEAGYIEVPYLYTVEQALALAQAQAREDLANTDDEIEEIVL